MHYTQKIIGAGLLFALGSAIIPAASAQELITNGGFETGSLSGWTTVDQNVTGSTGSFYARPDGTQFDHPYRNTVGPASGSYYAVSDQKATFPVSPNGSHALLQSFTVAAPAKSVILSFDMFVDNYNGSAATPASLDYTVVPNQQARVDILSAGASAFDTGAGDLENFYKGSDPVTDPNIDNPHQYTHYSFDITSLVGSGGTFQLRFAEANNQDNLYQGVDNVSIAETPAVPEASTMVSFGLLIVGAGGLLLHGRKRVRQATLA